MKSEDIDKFTRLLAYSVVCFIGMLCVYYMHSIGGATDIDGIQLLLLSTIAIMIGWVEGVSPALSWIVEICLPKKVTAETK